MCLHMTAETASDVVLARGESAHQLDLLHADRRRGGLSRYVHFNSVKRGDAF